MYCGEHQKSEPTGKIGATRFCHSEKLRPLGFRQKSLKPHAISTFSVLDCQKAPPFQLFRFVPFCSAKKISSLAVHDPKLKL
jgi:hypothetical protein